MNYEIVAIPNGKWKQNCYLITDKNSRTTLIIDPGSDGFLIRQKISFYKCAPVAIINTHAHYDHIGAVSELMSFYKIPFYLNPADIKLMNQANLYKFLFDSSSSIGIPKLTFELNKQNSSLRFSSLEISVIHTPGHTPGSVCLLIGSDLFSGDTLLSNGIGRTDLPGGDSRTLEKSLDLLRALPTKINVWPGHGSSFKLHSLWKDWKKANVRN